MNAIDKFECPLLYNTKLQLRYSMYMYNCTHIQAIGLILSHNRIDWKWKCPLSKVTNTDLKNKQILIANFLTQYRHKHVHTPAHLCINNNHMVTVEQMKNKLSTWGDKYTTVKTKK